jgi:dienelactone hydrolase
MTRRLLVLIFIFSGSCFWAPVKVSGDIVRTPVHYRQGDTDLEGTLVYDNASQSPRPGIIVFPEWWGLTDYPKHRAEQLAQLGYVAFAADMYGNAKTTDSPDEAQQLMKSVEGDTDLMRARAQAAVDVLSKDPHVDPKKIAAIGYCMGGTVALELARGGAPLLGVVGFHAGLATKNPDDAKNIKGKILICTGGDDAFVPPAQINAFEDEMRAAHVDWQMNVYSGAHHAFTNPQADSHHIPTLAYNEQADKRSWEAMKNFLAEVFE